ncbi:MAG: adenylate/guanylate cyclase domain-containing protein [Rhizobiaceae bacterium]
MIRALGDGIAAITRRISSRRQKVPGVRLARLAGIALLIAMIGVRISDPVFVQTLRNQSFDFYQRVKPRPYQELPVAIVDIDERSLREFGQWPWPRTRMGELVEKLTAMGAITIGFDIVFAEPDRLSPERIAEDNPALPAEIRASLLELGSNEQSFARAIAASRVVVGETSVRSRSDADELAQAHREIPPMSIAMKGGDPSPWLPRFPALVQNMEIISTAAAGHGVFTVDPDADGIFRRVPLIMKVGGQFRLSLATEVLRVATGGFTAQTRMDDAGLQALVVGKVPVPTDSNGGIWPWFSHTSDKRYVPAGSILDGTADPQAIAGHMILVGTSAVGLEDYRATPIAAQMPGVEIHAQIIENILSRQYLTRPNYAIGMETVFVALTGLFVIWLVPQLGAVWAFLSAILLLSAYFAGSAWMFAQHRLLIDATFPFAAITGLFMMMATANYMREESQRRQIRGAFGQYLSPALVDQLSDNPELLALGGETRELSVLFTDVRKFTTISEAYKRKPQGLTKLMNRFLTAMSNPILEQEGTIDKYMGDAIMAFWNAPLPDENHAQHACRSALAMIEAVSTLNQQRKQELENDPSEPFHEINIGIGINTGDCVVGNMGSDMRFDYTALGDTVNLASRLEGLSKPYGIAIILGNGTAELVKDGLPLLEVDLVRVKGKSEPEKIHALVGGETLMQDDVWLALRALNASMLSSYRNQDWDSAYRAVEQMEPLAEKLGIALSEYLFIYEARISEFRANPPGKGWDGIYDATEK